MRYFRVGLMVTALCSGQSITIERVAREAAERYPSTRVSTEQVAAAAASVDLARAAYLPRVDLLAQVNRATRNNVFGMLLPQSIIPSISGPPLATNSVESVWGSATGALFSWEPFDFGQRRAQVQAAEAGQVRAQKTADRIRFETTVLAADAFLALTAATEAIKATDAGIARAKTLLSISDALVKADLRPGVDASRARAELARAETERLQAIRNADVARAELAQYIDVSGQVEAAKLLATLPPSDEPGVGTHPLVAEQQAAVEQARASLHVLDKAWMPRFNLQAAAYGRGTGAVPDGRTLGGVNGLGPNIHNWGAGFTATFPIFDFASIRARTQAEVHRERAEAARLDQVRLDLSTAAGRARAELRSAIEIARQAPVQLEAARATEQQATARYRAGLSSIVDLADAQRLVTQAEIEDALARLTAWRALLRVAAAVGSIEPFLNAAK